METGADSTQEPRRTLKEKLTRFLDAKELTKAYNEHVWPVVSLLWLKKLHYWLLEKQANIKPGQKILEVGSGNPPHYNAMADKVGQEGTYIALDINPSIQRKARRSYLFWLEDPKSHNEHQAGGRASQVVGDAVQNLPFADQTFDTVIASNFTGDTFGPLKLDGWDYLKEVFRVLKPGGKLVASWGDTIVPTSATAYLKRITESGFKHAKLRPGAPIVSPIVCHWYLTGEKPANSSQ